MNMYRTTCNPQRIQLFLDQKLSDAELSAFESHLSHCDDCRRRLETTVASEDLWSEMRESLRDDQLPPDGLQSGDSDSTGEDASSSQTTVLKLLAPTDDDRMLGRWGTYEVVGVVGTGGMGVVLKAFDAALNRYVAIKVLAPHLGSSGAARKRFSREARASAAVVHDNVIEIYDVAETAGLPYLVMPYVRGPSLQRRLDDGGPMALAEILRVGMQAAAGLAAAHAQGLVHRDVKPANILLADGIERVKLTDFGLARAADDASLTKTGVIAGTPQYMSPEQARGEAVDQRSDLFSLGSVLYAMCTGRPPFRAETSYGVLRRITDEEPRPIREINPEIPEWLCGIVAKLMAKRPDDRFQSAQEVAKLLEECLAHVQQPTVVPLPAFSPLPLGEGQGVRVVAGTYRPGPFAGWLGRKRILAAIGLLVFGGLGLAFGILIHLKKDGKTTTIEVPDGSTAHIDAQGAVTVELPSTSRPAATAPGTREGKISRVPTRDPAIIRPLDVLQIRVAHALREEPIDGYYGVEPDGNVAIGPTYGRVNVNGLNVEQAEAKIVEKLKTFLKSPMVQVISARTNPPWHEATVRQPFTIRPFDMLTICVSGTLPDHPIDNYFLVESEGTVPLGPEYGRVQLKGLTVEEAEKAITRKLRDVLKEPEVQVTLPSRIGPGPAPKAPFRIKANDLLYIVAAWVPPDQPIQNVYAVEPRGTVLLGRLYGRVSVQGLSLEAAEKAIRKKLMEFAKEPKVSVTLAGWMDGNFSPVPWSVQRSHPCGPAAGGTCPGVGTGTHLESGTQERKTSRVPVSSAPVSSAPVSSPAIERVTVDSDKAVIEGRASTNDAIVFVFGEKEAMSQTFPSSVHFQCTLGEGEAGDEMGPVARVTDAGGKELPGMPAQILPVSEPVFVEPSSPAMIFMRGSLHFRSGSATRRPDGTVIVADCWANPVAPFYARRVPFGVKLIPAARKNQKERIGATVSGRVLTGPGGTGVAGARVGLRNCSGPVAWSRYAATTPDGTYAFDNVPPCKSPWANVNASTDIYNYEAWIEAAPDRPPGVWSEAVWVAVERQDVHAHDLYLKYPQSISGTVRDADTNQPITGAEIWFSSNRRGLASGGEGGPKALMLGPNRKVTDGQGRYRLYLRPREVTVSCDGTPDRYNRDDVHGGRTVVAEPQQETTVDFCCESGAPLRGRAVNPDGTPAKDARVRVSVDWPVCVTNIRGGFGGGEGRRGGGEGRRGGRASQGAGGDPDRRVPRTENWGVYFEAATDGEGQFSGYMRQPNLPDGEHVGDAGQRYTLQSTLPVSIRARAWLPDRSLGGVGRAEAVFGEPLRRPMLVTLQETGAAVVRVLFQDGRPVPDAEIRTDGFYPGSDSGLAGQQGKPVEYLGDGRYRIAGLTAGLDYRLRAFRRKLPTRSQTGKLEVKPGRTTDAGELRLEWEEGLAGDAQPRFRLEHGGRVDLVAFSPDGAMLASISDANGDGAKLTEVATGKVLDTGRIPAVCMAFFPKSDRLALGCSDGSLVLTNQKKLTAWKSFRVSHEGVYPVAVSPDGAMVACATSDETVDCWDVVSGRNVHALGAKRNHQGARNANPMDQMAGLAFSPDNKLLVAVDRKGLCKAWDLESEKESGKFQGVSSDNPRSVFISGPVSICFCPDGKTAAIGFEGAEPLQFWDPRGGKPPVHVSLPDAIQPKSDSTSAEGGPVKGPGHTVLSPDCKMAATVLDSGWVAVWDIPGRRVFQVFPAAGFAFPAGLAFSPDGRLLATSNFRGVVEVWEIDAAAVPQATRPLEIDCGKNRIFIKAWAPAGTRISFYAGDRNNGWGCVFPKATGFTASLEYAETGLNCRVVPDTGDPVLTLVGAKHIGNVVLSDGRFIFRNGPVHKERDGSTTVTIGRWAAKSGEVIEIGVTLTPPQSEGKTRSGTDTQLDSGTPERKTSHVPVSTAVSTANRFDPGMRVQTIACSPDGKLIAVGSVDPRLDGGKLADDWRPAVTILDGETGAAIASLKLTDKDEDAILAATPQRVPSVTALAFSPDGNTVAVGTSAGQVKLFAARSGALLRALDDTRAKLVAEKKLPEGSRPLALVTEGIVGSLAFSPDGSILATCGYGFPDFGPFDPNLQPGEHIVRPADRNRPGSVKLWDVKTGLLKHEIPGPEQVMAIAFSDDGGRLASAGAWEVDDGVFSGVIVWNARTGAKIHTIPSSNPWEVAFRPGNKSLALGSQAWKEGKGPEYGVSLVNEGSGKTVWQRKIADKLGQLAFSPDGKSLLVLSGGRSIQVLDAETGDLRAELRPADAAEGGRWNAFAVAPQTGKLAIGGVDAGGKGIVEIRTGKATMGENSRDSTTAAPSIGPAASVFGPLIERTVMRTARTDAELAHVDSTVDGIILRNAKVTDTGLARLASFSRLRLLWLDDTPISDAGLKNLAGLNGLRDLSLGRTGVTDSGLKQLAGLKQLESLSLSGDNITDAGLEHLKALPCLKELYLARTKITDAGLKNLKGLTRLKRLTLDGANVTDAGLGSLQSLCDLQRLDLSGTHVTDVGLPCLGGLTNLTWLTLTNTKVTAAGVKALQKSQPHCLIEWESNK